MVPEPDTSADAARAFAADFLEESFADVTGRLSESGRDAVVDAFPEGFQGGEMDAEEVLEEFWYGLYGQYGDPEGVGDVDVAEDGSNVDVAEDGGDVGDGDDADVAEDDSEAGTDVTVELRFADGSHDLELSVEDGEVVAFALPSEYEPPAYADPDAFAEREVTVDAGDVDLDGVLAVPEGDGPFPGVVLVHGAGIHDPDGTAGSAQILKDFAWGLAGQGVASLRYEKRLAEVDVPDEGFTLDAVVVDDAVAAVDRLAAADDVAEDGVFVVGHSQGGMAVSRIGERHGGVAGVVALDSRANTFLDPDDLDFMRYEFEVDGDLSEEQEQQLEADQETARRIAAGDFEDDETLWGRPAAWYHSLADYDPVDALARVDTPAFVAKTGRADEDLQPELAAWLRGQYETWRDADLPAESRTEFYEGVGHYFQEGHEPTSPAHLHFADNVAEYVVDDVAAWVHEVADA